MTKSYWHRLKLLEILKKIDISKIILSIPNQSMLLHKKEKKSMKKMISTLPISRKM
jgi:hypothetical protein